MNSKFAFSSFLVIFSCIFVLGTSGPLIPTAMATATNGSIIYLPLTLKNSDGNTLSGLLEQAIQSTVAASAMDLSVSSADFDGFNVTIHFNSPSAEALRDNHDFEEVLMAIEIRVSNLLDEQNYAGSRNFSYELFVNGDLLGGETPLPDEPVSINRQLDTIQNQRIVLSAGHGRYQASNSWPFQRAYFWGIIEDKMNADLILELHQKLGNTGATLYSARQLDRSVGNHSSGFPWWEMDAGNYVRSLGVPGSVWGETFNPLERHIVAPPEYANFVDADMLISIHNNGARGDSRGTLIMYDNANGYQEQSRRLAELIEARLIQRIHEQWDPTWHTFGARGYSGSYGENRRFDGPAVIIELAFMDNYQDNQALQNPAFRAIVTNAIREAILEYYNVNIPPSSGPTTFIGNVTSDLYFDANGGGANFKVCADNLPNQRVYARLQRPNRTFDLVSQVATSRCVTFYNMDGALGVLPDTPYTARAALNQPPNMSWPVPCYNATSGRGLCVTNSYSSGATLPINSGTSNATITTSSVNLQVCGSNITGKTIYVQMWRDAAQGYPARTWNSSQIANGTCTTFNDLDGAYDTFAGVNYYTVASLQPLGPAEAAQKREACYAQTNNTQLCNKVIRNTGSATAIVNGTSMATISIPSVGLQVCGDNLNGKTVYVQLWRDAAEGYPARTWNYSQVAIGTCTTFNDLDGAYDTFANTNYYTVAGIEPLGSGEAAQQRTSCYVATGQTRLCDKVIRSTVASNVIQNGSSTATITVPSVNLQVCGDNLNGKTVYVQMWRDTAEGYPARTWNVSQVANSNCVSFTDVDGEFDTFANTSYFTVAGIEPLGNGEAAQQRTSCYAATGQTRLCDWVIR